MIEDEILKEFSREDQSKIINKCKNTVQKDGTTQIVNKFDPDEENGEINPNCKIHQNIMHIILL